MLVAGVIRRDVAGVRSVKRSLKGWRAKASDVRRVLKGKRGKYPKGRILMDKIKQAIGLEPYYEEENGVLYNADCLDIMKKMPGKCVDLVLTDPPYGMNFRSNYRQEKHDKIIGDDKFPIEIIGELQRIAKRAVYIFCRWDNLNELPKPKSVLAWVKNNWSMGDLKHEHGRQ